jgi:hypothetical protein
MCCISLASYEEAVINRMWVEVLLSNPKRKWIRNFLLYWLAISVEWISHIPRSHRS